MWAEGRSATPGRGGARGAAGTSCAPRWVRIPPPRSASPRVNGPPAHMSGGLPVLGSTRASTPQRCWVRRRPVVGWALSRVAMSAAPTDGKGRATARTAPVLSRGPRPFLCTQLPLPAKTARLAGVPGSTSPWLSWRRSCTCRPSNAPLTATGSASLSRERWVWGSSARSSSGDDSIRRAPGAVRVRRRPLTSTRQIETTTTRPSTDNRIAWRWCRPRRDGNRGEAPTPVTQHERGQPPSRRIADAPRGDPRRDLRARRPTSPRSARRRASRAQRGTPPQRRSPCCRSRDW